MTMPTIDKLDTEASAVSVRRRRRLLLALVPLGLTAALTCALYGPRRVVVPIEEPEIVSVHLLTPGEEQWLFMPCGDDFTLTAPPELENYRFIGWRTEDGRLLNSHTLQVDRELYFAAEYAVKLEADRSLPLLRCDERANYRPFEPLTRAECAEMLASLLAAPVTPGKGFPDLGSSYACTESARKLQTLGLFPETLFHPKQPMSRATFFTMLASFYPASQDRFVFSDLDPFDPGYAAFCTAAEQGWIESGETEAARPNDLLTRAEAAVVMNRLLGRRYRPGVFYVSDLDKKDAYYRDIVTAAGSLAYQKPVRDLVLDGKSLGELEPGLHLEGTVLFCVTEDHELLRNDSYQGFSFDARGHFTTGDKELDELLFPALREACEGLEDREDMLKAIYNYIMDHARYLKRHYYTLGDTSWVYDEAKTMLSTWRGNCYNYSSTLYFMTRAIGYDTVIYSGFVTESRHGWCEIPFDGEPYIFDVELQDAYMDRKGEYLDMYKKSYYQLRHWRYVRGEAKPPLRGPHCDDFINKAEQILVRDAPDGEAEEAEETASSQP